MFKYVTWPNGRILGVVGVATAVLIALLSAAATQVFATGTSTPQPTTPGDSIALRNSAGSETVRAGEQVDGSNGVKVAHGAGTRSTPSQSPQWRAR